MSNTLFKTNAELIIEQEGNCEGIICKNCPLGTLKYCFDTPELCVAACKRYLLKEGVIQDSDIRGEMLTEVVDVLHSKVCELIDETVDLEHKITEATEALEFIEDELQCSGKRYLLHFIKETLETIQ